MLYNWRAWYFGPSGTFIKSIFFFIQKAVNLCCKYACLYQMGVIYLVQIKVQRRLK